MFYATQISDEQDLSDKSSVSENEKARPKPLRKLKKTQVDRDSSTRVFKEENKLRISEKLTKSQASKMLKPMPKRQNEVESVRALIMKRISLLEKD